MENAALLKEYVKTGLASYTFRPWKLAMLGVGTLFLVVGGGLSVVERRDSSSVRDTVAKSEKQVDGPVAATSTERPGVHSIAPGDHPTLPPGIILDDPPTGPTDDESKSGGEPTGDAQGVSSVDPANWSPVFLKGGFGFFVGFCVGFAIRTLL